MSSAALARHHRGAAGTQDNCPAAPCRWMATWEPGKQPLAAKPRGKMGRPPRLLQRSTDHQPVSVKHLAMNLPSTAFQEVTWREGTDRKLHSRFAAVRIRVAHRDYEKAEPH